MSLAIIGDVFPENRRGSATGSLMTGFALASIAGVPVGLYFGTNYGWHIPFVALAIGGIPTLLLSPFALPPLNGHVGKTHSHPVRSIVEIFSEANHINAFALIIMLMIGSFSVFPMLSPYLVKNVGLSEDQLPLVYIAGGVLTLFTAPVVGRLADRYGKLLIYCVIVPVASVLMVVITHLPRVPIALAIAAFGSLMMCNVGRMIAAMAMVTSSVVPQKRGSFLSINASLQHVASGIGAYLGGVIVTKASDGRIEHFGTVGWFAAACTLSTLWLAGRVKIADPLPTSAEAISLAAAAEVTVDAGEPMLSYNEVVDV
jgi:predicted MFS family arabinose efflux permease